MRFVLVVALAALASCGPPEPRTYSPEYELNFMNACRQGQTASVCSCAWERITREIPVEDFESFEQLPPNEQAAQPLRAEFQRYTLECIAQNQAPPEDPPPP